MEETPPCTGVLAVVQARMGSSRLPGKPLLSLGDSTLLDQTIQRVRASGIVSQLVVAAPAVPDTRPLNRYCREKNIPCVLYKGEETDVLGRILYTARRFQATTIARIQCCDPLLDPKMLWAAACHLQDTNMDIVSVGRLPIGTACEVMSLKTLLRLDAIAKTEEQREEVTSLAWKHRDLFECALLPAPLRLRFPEINLRVQTEDSYQLMQEIFSSVPPRPSGLISLTDVISYLHHHPELLSKAIGAYAVVRSLTAA